MVNELAEVGAGSPLLLTTDRIATVNPSVETHVIVPECRFWDFRELPSFAYNDRLREEASRILCNQAVRFVYQRYAANNFAGLEIARERGVPFVLEYNGSEVWIERNWGRPLGQEKRSARIETLLIRSADLVVVVSEPLRRELLDRGVSDARILVNPNGVDTDRYAPGVDGSGVRNRYGLGTRLVIGFIGTFGPWHGAEVLADAFGQLLSRSDVDRDDVRLLFIGDGPRLAATQVRIALAKATDETIFVGRTDQRDGPAYLAAADILVAPHVPNTDGSPFFGSPTKIFEYMAMGRAIVASRLDQIGQVLEDPQTALLVAPADANELAAAMARLVGDPDLRSRLGGAARARAVEMHTWRAHTRRIIEALTRCCA